MIIVDDPRDVRLFDGLIILNVGGLYGDTSMAKKIGYTPISIFAAGCEAIATAAALTNPATAPFAVGIGTAASAVAGGIELNDEEKNIKDNLDKAMDKAWATIDKKYRLSLHTEKYTDNCLTELKREVMGENTSVEEFVRNTEIKGFEPSIALVIQGILKKHIVTLNRDPEIIWSDEYTENAAKDMASILVDAIKSVFENVDHLRILKAIYKSEERIVTELHQATNQVIGEIRNVKPIPTEAPLSLTYIPPAINLIGREKDIQGIYDLFEQHNIVFIHADGGVGKTAAAAKIVNQIKDEITSGKRPYKHVAWITSTGDLKSDLTGLSIPLVDTMKTPEEKYQIVSTYLQSNPTFLVIDNMDQPPTREDSNKLNTITGQTKVLITSRADIPYAEEYLLVELDPDSALVLFYRHYRKKEMTIEQIRDRKDCSFGENIVKAATYNALFIELIGKMAYADHWKLGDLWEMLSVDIFGVDSKHPIYVTHGDYGKLLEHIQKLYEMSGLSEKQKELMSFMALFPSECSIFFDVFEWAGFEDDDEDNLGALQERGWIERDDIAEGYMIHSLVKGSVEKQFSKMVFDENRYTKFIHHLATTDKYFLFDNEITKVKKCIIVPKTVCKLLENNNSRTKNTASLFMSLGFGYLLLGDYKDALENYRKALDIREEQGDEKEMADSYTDIAIAFTRMGDYYEALNNYRKVLEIYEKDSKTESDNLIILYINMAGVYLELENYDMAIEYYRNALLLCNDNVRFRFLFVPDLYDDIAIGYLGKGDYEEALKNCKHALKCRKDIYDENHYSFEHTYTTMANIYQEQKKYEEALKYYVMAKDIWTETHEIGNYYTSTLMCYIASIYYYQDNIDEALKYYISALDIRIRKLGKDHPDTAKIYCYLAKVYFAKCQYEKVQEYLDKALKVFQEKLGYENSFTKSVVEKLGEVKRNTCN